MNSIVKKKSKPMRMIKFPIKMIPLRKVTDPPDKYEPIFEVCILIKERLDVKAP
jgi:hypothetical protein